MPVKLKVSQESASAAEQEYLYHDDVITMGRKETNLLLLPDPFKKLVSRRHARIERNGTAYFLFDLESQNHTYLNGACLESGRPYELHNGDELRIGDYHLQFFALMLEAEPGDSGEVALHPFVNETNELQRILLRLAEKYARADAKAREEILFQALLEPMQRLAESDMREIFTRAFAGPNRSAVTNVKETLPPAPGAHVELLEARAMVKELSAKLEEKEAGLQLLREEIRRLKGNSTGASKPDTTSTKPLDAITMTVREKQALELLLEAFAKLVRCVDQVNVELTPTTIMQSKIAFEIRNSSAEALYKLLCLPAATEEEGAERFNSFKKAAREIMLHPVALMEGHSACMRESASGLLSELAPEQVQSEAFKKISGSKWRNALARVFPLWLNRKLFQAYRQRHRELLQDLKALSQKHLDRPFTSAYNRRMRAARMEAE